MALGYWQCWHSYSRQLERLTDEEIGRLFRALMKFSETGERVELQGIESLAFDFIAVDIEKSKAAYAEKCRKNAENIQKRWNTTV